jgi:hypothetical protein
MTLKRKPRLLLLSVLLLSTLAEGATGADRKNVRASVESTGAGANAVLWRNPADLPSRDLFYGPGGPAHQPHGELTFTKEDLNGTNPKFHVRDADDVKWTVKLGSEARPETAASRLVWAAGYFSNEDYFLASAHIDEMPSRLHRGQKLVHDSTVSDVRLKREHLKKVGIWHWSDDPFIGTRELNGLRVMMALINNWDLKDDNNAVYQNDNGDQVYLVSDLGASFGTSRADWPLTKSKGNLKSYSRSKFITKVTPTRVDFADPGCPGFIWFVRPADFFHRIELRWIGRSIPRSDARWIGELLGQLSPSQIRDAFRAAGYSPDEADGFVNVVEGRIAALRAL